MPLNQDALTVLEARMIDPETATQYGVYTGGFKDGKPTNNPHGHCLVWPYNENGVAVNDKCMSLRDIDTRELMIEGHKKWQRTGGEKTFWNADILDDPAVIDGTYPLIITEGEWDAISVIQSGYPYVVSVPEGAPPPKGNGKSSDVDELDDTKGKFLFMHRNRERLNKIKRFIIAADADANGMELAKQLVLRLRESRCMFVEYPSGCKDFNSVLIKHGAKGILDVITQAKLYPIDGLFHISDYPEEGDIELFTTGWRSLDPHLQLWPGELMIVTGIPGHGKSVWVLNMLARLAKLHKWVSVIYTPEMRVKPRVVRALRRASFGLVEPEHIDRFLENRFMFIGGKGYASDPPTINWVMDKANAAIDRFGAKVVLIDPWNQVEHHRDRYESMEEYIGRQLCRLKQFAEDKRVVVIVVAHPTKDVGRDGKIRPPSLYDIHGAAHWYNKCDHGVVVFRVKNEGVDVCTEIHIDKCKFEENGVPGSVRMRYADGQYTHLDGSN